MEFWRLADERQPTNRTKEGFEVSRRSRQKSTLAARTDARQFLKRMGVSRTRAPEQVLARVEALVGPAGASDLADVLEKRGAGDLDLDPYPLLFQSPEVAVETAALAAWVTEEALTRLAGGPAPTTALDLGCGCGLLTIFAALRNPSARAVGIDRSRDAIRVARELADRVGALNAEFHVGSAVEPLDLGTFELVTAITFAVEADPLFRGAIQHHPLHLLTALSEVRDLDPPRASVTLAQFVEAGGRMISIERMNEPVTAARWVAGIERSGLQVDWERTIFKRHLQQDHAHHLHGAIAIEATRAIVQT